MTEHYDPTLNENAINLLLQNGLADSLPQIAQLLMNAAMLLERTVHLQAEPHQRCDTRTGHANGFKPRGLQTAFGKLNLAIPQVRDCPEPFHTSLLEQGSRTDRALKTAIATMYLQGVSTRRVTKIVGDLCGMEVTSTQVSRLTAELDQEFEKWRTRPLPDIAHLFLDATYIKVRLHGAVRDCAVLTAIGIQRDNSKRIALGVSAALSEAEPHWRDFITSLRERGLGLPDSVTSDAHQGIQAALRATLPSIPWQRCQFHLQQNAQAHVPRQDLKTQVASDLRHIFDAADRPHAEAKLAQTIEKYRHTAPKLSTWMEANLAEGLTVFCLPEPHRKRLRTSNMCETLNHQIKRRTRVAGLFPNEASILRLVTAILSEISDEWETGKTYLSPNKT